MLKLVEKRTIDNPQSAIEAMQSFATNVSTEKLPWQQVAGRVLAQSISADRDYPPWNTSAVDGYAVNAGRALQGRLQIGGSIVPGSAPCLLHTADTIQIFTGGALPADADAVIPREQVNEKGSFIESDQLTICRGQGVRFAGESVLAGQRVLNVGQVINAPQLAASAAYGVTQLEVFRRVRVKTIITGSELVDSEAPLQPWQIRDSNGPALMALLGNAPWIDWQGASHVIDDPLLIRSAIAEALETSDVLLITGGVSVGDHDYVREALVSAGGTPVFHRLPIRPGKPLLGAIGPNGQAIFGLPGNPLSVMVTARRFVVPVLRLRAGFINATEPEQQVCISNPDDRLLNLHWFRLVRHIRGNDVELLCERNSGDLAAAAQSDGFIQVAAGVSHSGPWPFFSWKL